MVRFAIPRRLMALTLLVLVVGCAWPHGRGAPASIVKATHPNQVFAESIDKPPPGPDTVPAISRVAYQTPGESSPVPSQAASERAPLPEEVALGAGQPALTLAAPERGAAAPSGAMLPLEYGSDDPFNGQEELSVEQLVAEVQVRNPSLQAVSDAWRAATERYPQVISLDDPMFTWMISPSGVGTMDSGGWMVQASQNIPWTCKRALRGSVASAEANAMRGDIGDTRLMLAEATRVAFFDYYMAWRQMEVNATTQTLVKQLREIAWNKYQVNQVTQQDVLQADVELADLATRSAELTRDQQIAQARINTLLHRAADHPLPPPPAEVPFPDELPAADDLQQVAIRSRPDLFAQVSRIRAEEANLALACREYYPDLNFVAKYDGFMPEDMRPQLGMDVNIPIRYSRRSAAVHEASHQGRAASCRVSGVARPGAV